MWTSPQLLAASFGSAALDLVEDIEGGYFDKLRASPVSRSAIVLARLVAEGAKTAGASRRWAWRALSWCS